MAEQLNLQVNVSGNATQSVQSLKKELREAQAQVAILSDKFGATSKQAVEAAKRAAELKDRIGDAKALTDAFNPDAKFKALSASISGVAAGYSALQGAIGLFGEENKNLEKQLLKVQSALAFSQGLQGLFESIDSFKNLATVIKTQVVTAFSTLRGAIAATGLGLLAIAIPLIIQNFDKLKEALYRLIPALKPVGDFLGNIIDKAAKFLGFKDEEVKKVETTNKKVVDDEIEKNKKLEAERQRAAEERRKKIEEEKRAEAARLQKLREDELEAQRAAFRLEIQALENRSQEAKRIAKEEDDTVAELFAQEEQRQDQLQKTRSANIIKQNEDQKKLAEDTVAREQAKQNAYYMTGMALGELSELVGRTTAAGKALSLAQAIINTYTGVTEVLANKTTIPEPFGTIQKVASVATILASGLNAVKNIAKTPVAGRGGSGSISVPTGMSMTSPIAPTSNIATTRIDQASINAIGNQAIRAYVVETDISASQKRIEAIKQKAKFG